MKRILINSSIKTLASTAFGILMLTSANAHAAVSQSPLSLTIGVPPNLLLTLDDSGSMRWAFVPDDKDSFGATRRAKANRFNPMYYDPSIDYQAPMTFDSSGNEQQLSTSYTAAYANGFDTSQGNLNLTNGYLVSWTYNLEGGIGNTYGFSNTTTRLAENPSTDFRCVATATLSNGQTTSCNIANGTKVTITRTSTGCTAKIGGWVDGACSRSSSTYTASWTQKGVPAYYYTYDAANTGCDNNVGTEACYTLKFVSTEEQQNFANWYSFYKNRALATLSAASLAFYDLSPSIRLSWQGLGRCTKFDGTDSNCKNNKFKAYTPAHKGQLYAWMKDVNFDQTTYLPAAMSRAGEFYKTATPWLKFPADATGNTAANTYACRPAYHIMMTDGLWNSTTGDPTGYVQDDSVITLPDGKTYNKQHPYADTTKRTLADLAMHYWATDLRPGAQLANDLAPYIPFKSGDAVADYWDPRNDPANWQHMVNFMMGLGLTEALNNKNIPWEGSTFSGTGYNKLAAGTVDWPAASSGSNNNVYDLWHAAINSRGEFFSVDSPNAMVQAFADILSRIADRKSTASRPAISSGQVSEDEGDNGTIKTVSYQTSYASDENWAGDLKRTEKAWNSVTNTFGTSEVWSAEAKLPAWDNRRIKIASTDTDGLMDFNWTNAGSAATAGTLAYYLNRNPEDANAADNKGEQRLAYIRGSNAGEGTTFRQRTKRLGDIYSSSPAVVSGPRYLIGFANQIEGGTTYQSFATSIAGRTPMVYVGGNDGMLHGFNAKTGVEEFAFIPTAVFPKLNKLTGSNYSHEFYVDGSPVVADVFNGTTWRTILVGTLKAGGKSIFALDITNPNAIELLWEFSEDSITGSNAVKMGYSFSQPTIARLHTGKWAVVFGNGYESANNTNGKAALFILDALDGELIRSLEVTGTAGIANGLSTPKLGDYNADGVADYAYAGDLQGNLWRFDLLRNNRSQSAPFTREDDAESAKNDFEVSYGGSPMFSAVAANGTTRQSITSAPSLIRHPSGIGYMVIFGTGKFFETTDKDGDKSVAQTVYGIWDEKTKGENATAPSITRAKLQEQTITNQVTATNADGTGGRTARIISSNPVQWNATDTAAKQHGWRLDLALNGSLDGEMVVENMAALGQTVFFQSLIPNDDPCADGTSNWSYAINPYTGGKTSHHAFDVRHTTDVGDTVIVSGIKQDGEGGLTVAQNPDQSFDLCTGQECVSIYPDPNSMGRQSWRVVEEE